MIADLAAWLAEIDATRALIIAVLTFAGSVVAGLSGMGGGILIAIAITPVIGVKALVPTMAVTMTINHVARVWAFRRDVEWPPALAILTTSIPMTVIGSSIYVSLRADTIAIVMGTFFIVFVPLRRWLERRRWRLGQPGLAGVGVVFGLVSGTTLGGGMLVVPALLGSGLAGATLIGTDAVVGLTILATKVAAFGTLELLTARLAAIGALVGICSMPGVWVARAILRRTSVERHTLLVELIILAGGVSFLWHGLNG